ncbi:response regulator [Couchioplanes azureus]|uniref:response regulator n=1 Tax=Couchioplanes caeruleus TaxID=56438 RepID=UPI00167065D2|nr:response regulator [Couchioplanes caeruleus]GGQ72824.1 hypothetical protein GCM10010166_48520 [Couchioplanes caeruleus subsp. azureus]
MATLLLGEIDTDIRIAFTMLFRRAGYHVITAADPRSILETAQRQGPDLVILNLRDDDGPDTCRILRADALTSDTPVLMLSADLYPDAGAAAAAGADAYLAKPLNNDDLLHQVHSLLTARTGECPTGRRDRPADADAGVFGHEVPVS